ncbi:MAG TPA: Holliday junction branch migration protein RuvA [Thermodesulfobacteriota bacterium]|nr:Holliday junction branch migration protein RuvA [Thermodesulfobacteriota bacterium]
MIAHLNGKLIQKSMESVVIDVGGVGYALSVPLSTFTRLPDTNQPVTLNVHTHLKDDSIELYGFLTQEEKEVFKLLISVTGIGPRLARNILSGVEVDDLVAALAGEDRARLNSIPGIGAKAAERLIIELKDKVLKLKSRAGRTVPAVKDPCSEDVASALGNLGYKYNLAEAAVRKTRERLGDGAGFEELFKEALKTLAKR